MVHLEVEEGLFHLALLRPHPPPRRPGRVGPFTPRSGAVAAATFSGRGRARRAEALVAVAVKVEEREAADGADAIHFHGVFFQEAQHLKKKVVGTRPGGGGR